MWSFSTLFFVVFLETLVCDNDFMDGFRSDRWDYGGKNQIDRSLEKKWDDLSDVVLLASDAACSLHYFNSQEFYRFTTAVGREIEHETEDRLDMGYYDIGYKMNPANVNAKCAKASTGVLKPDGESPLYPTVLLGSYVHPLPCVLIRNGCDNSNIRCSFENRMEFGSANLSLPEIAEDERRSLAFDMETNETIVFSYSSVQKRLRKYRFNLGHFGDHTAPPGKAETYQVTLKTENSAVCGGHYSKDYQFIVVEGLKIHIKSDFDKEFSPNVYMTLDSTLNTEAQFLSCNVFGNVLLVTYKYKAGNFPIVRTYVLTMKHRSDGTDSLRREGAYDAAVDWEQFSNYYAFPRKLLAVGRASPQNCNAGIYDKLPFNTHVRHGHFSPPPLDITHFNRNLPMFGI